MAAVRNTSPWIRFLPPVSSWFSPRLIDTEPQDGQNVGHHGVQGTLRWSMGSYQCKVSPNHWLYTGLGIFKATDLNETCTCGGLRVTKRPTTLRKACCVISELRPSASISDAAIVFYALQDRFRLLCTDCCPFMPAPTCQLAHFSMQRLRKESSMTARYCTAVTTPSVVLQCNGSIVSSSGT